MTIQTIQLLLSKQQQKKNTGMNKYQQQISKCQRFVPTVTNHQRIFLWALFVFIEHMSDTELSSNIID